MGTKLEHIVNPIAYHKTTNIIAGNLVNDGEICRRRLIGKMSWVERLQDVMNRIMEKGDVEAIRNTMLIHEDVFKHQVQRANPLKMFNFTLHHRLSKVRELHRLYCVQKKLTEEFQEKINYFHHRSLRDDVNLKEHSGSCLGSNLRISRGFDLERHAEEDISTGKNMNNEDRVDQRAGHDRENKNTVKTHDSYDEDSEVELTLSIGGSLSKKSSKSSSPLKHKNILEGISFFSSFKSEREKELNDPTTPMSSSSATCDPDAKRSHGLFQSLKL